MEARRAARDALFPALLDPPDRPALRVGADSLSYPELSVVAGALAVRLAGASRGVVVAAPSLHTAVGITAALLAGVPVVPLNPRLGRRELEHVLADAAPDVVLAGPGADVPGPLAALPRVDVDLAASGPVPRAEPPPEAPALIVYTSGTTGPPKGAVLARAAIAANLDALADAWAWTADDLLVHALPLFHVHGLVLGVLGVLRRGGAVHHLGALEAPALAAAVGSGATMVFGVPTQYHRLADQLDADPEAAATIGRARLLVSGSAALTAADHARLRRATGLAVRERYGLTETLILTAARADEEPETGTVGRPLAGTEVRLAPLPTAPGDAPADDLGCVEVRGPGLFSGYLNRPDATAAARTPDGWFATGDIGHWTPSGALAIVGRRATDLIKSGGYKIGAGEIENALLEHPAVAECAVIGVPDDDLGERVLAFVVAAGAAPPERALIDHVATLLAPHKRPREVRFVDTLPRNDLGKVVKARLPKAGSSKGGSPKGGSPTETAVVQEVNPVPGGASSGMTRTAPTSTTWKTYRGPAAAGPPSLVGLPGVHTDSAEPEQVLETERYDTDGCRLAAARIMLIAERGDGPDRWRLQLPDGDGVETLRIPANGAAAVPPEEFAALLRGASRDRAVRPVGRVRRVRVTTRLLAADDRVLALVVHDHVTLATQGRSTTVDGWTEVELRRAQGSSKLLAAVEERLIESGVVPAEDSGDVALAALDRLLGASAAKRRRAGKRGSAGAALLDHLAAQVDKLASEDLRVRRDEPDAVHRLRVSSRRLRSALQAYRPLLDRERTDPLVDGLRTLGRQLAPARDAEVLHERISTGLAELDPVLLLGPVQAQVTRHFARVESEARAAVLAELDSDRYAALRTALDDLLDRPPLTERAARPARHELPRMVAKSARRLEKAVRAATDPDAPRRDEAVHAARKAVKRLRYATDVARQAVGKPAERFATGLKGLQTALGEHQDTVVARGVLRELGAQAHSAGENGFSFGVLHGHDAALARSTENELPALWKAAWLPKNRKWLP